MLDWFVCEGTRRLKSLVLDFCMLGWMWRVGGLGLRFEISGRGCAGWVRGPDDRR